MNWPPAVWQAIDELAQLDLAHYPKHVHDRQAFLGKARAKRVEQHRVTIDALVGSGLATKEEILAVCNPQPVHQDPPMAQRRDYDRVFPVAPFPPLPEPCHVCRNSGRVEAGYCTVCERGTAKRAIDAARGRVDPRVRRAS